MKTKVLFKLDGSCFNRIMDACKSIVSDETRYPSNSDFKEIASMIRWQPSKRNSVEVFASCSTTAVRMQASAFRNELAETVYTKYIDLRAIPSEYVVFEITDNLVYVCFSKQCAQFIFQQPAKSVFDVCAKFELVKSESNAVELLIDPKLVLEVFEKSLTFYPKVSVKIKDDKSPILISPVASNGSIESADFMVMPIKKPE